MNRIFHGSNGGEEELNISMGLLLVLLTVPGGFVSILLQQIRVTPAVAAGSDPLRSTRCRPT